VGVLAGLLGLLYAGMHGAIVPSMFNAPPAERGSGQFGAVPAWARLLWAVCVGLTAVGALVLVFAQPAVVVFVLAIGVVGIVALAVGNGVWMKGRPTLSHHVVRAAFALVVLVPALLSID
jgi:drug/metabolite transporter (DMT)-like permease